MNSIEKIKQNFLKETYQDTWNVYENSITNNFSDKWDWIVLTASNKEQAETYKQEIDERLIKNLLPKETKYLIMEDPKGKRVGSGGATLNVLKKIKENSTEKEFKNAKILVIHSGGDSKRIPQYSACGKLFSPVQRELPDGRTSTLFDEFIIAFSAVPARMSPGMIVLSGDVLLVFNPLQIDLHYLDSAAISIKAPVETGCNHGVFLTDNDGMVKQFLHKQKIEKLKELKAVNSNGCVDIDTGAIYFSTKILEELLKLISKNNIIDKIKYNEFVNENSRISFYGDFLYPLAIDSTYENYLKEAAEGTINENLLACRQKIWEKLNKYKMKVIKLAPAEFIHYGTTKELFELLINNLKKYECLNWNKKVLSNISKSSNCVINHSYIDENAQISENVYIENSYIGENVIIGENTILSNVCLEDITIPNNVCINTMLTKNKQYVSRIYAIEDNPKTEKTEETKFLGRTLEKMMYLYKIDENQIWKTKEKSIWKANLYVKEENEKASIKSAVMLYKIINCEASLEETKEYFSKDRTSLWESFIEADMPKIREKNQEVEFKLRSYEFINAIKRKEDIKKAKKILLKSKNICEQIKNLIDVVKNEDYMIRSRAFLAIAEIIKENKIEYFKENFEDKCYDEIKKALITENNTQINKEKIKNSVYVELPIRINFGGGWSDTPPYCNENGGAVLNGAFKLDDKKPIKVKVEKNNLNNIILKSVDLKAEKKFTNINELKNCTNTNDPFSLVKASLIVSGIVKKSDKSIKNVIDRVGCGFEITTDVTLIPKGSGLGTSSILAGACLKAIYKFLAIDITEEKLVYKTLEQEQFMGTGGGWQDQIGGIIPGIKYTLTKNDVIQKFNIERLQIDDELREIINKRFVLIYSGQRRLAKNLLREIMNKYIENDSATINTIGEIKQKATEMTKALKDKDLDMFCKLLNEHWILSKKLDKGCSNSCIDQILEACEDYIEGKMICGAGGGGFLQVVLKEGISKEILNQRIQEVFQDSGIKMFNITLA